MQKFSICPIASGSKGNSYLITNEKTNILLDCGISLKALKTGLLLLNKVPEDISAIVVTHEHTDHIKALEQLLKHTKLPIFASGGTINALKCSGKIPENAPLYDIKDGYRSAAFEVSAFPTSHDSAQSVGFTVRFGKDSFGICTDTGFVTEQAEKALTGCRTVLIESNYDEEMLRKNLNYPPDLKRRISGNQGHLSNSGCAEFALKLLKSGTRHLVLGHLSRENNTPATAKSRTERLLADNGAVIERDFTLCAAPVMTTGEYISV